MRAYEKRELGKELSDLWYDLDEDMLDDHAYEVACDQLGIDPEDGHEYIRLFNTENMGLEQA